MIWIELPVKPFLKRCGKRYNNFNDARNDFKRFI